MFISFMDSRLWPSSSLIVSISSGERGVNTPASVIKKEMIKITKMDKILLNLVGNALQYLLKFNYSLPLMFIFKILKPLAMGFNISVILTFSKTPLKSSA